jgi:hypothetical protein
MSVPKSPDTTVIDASNESQTSIVDLAATPDCSLSSPRRPTTQNYLYIPSQAEHIMDRRRKTVTSDASSRPKMLAVEKKLSDNAGELTPNAA